MGVIIPLNGIQEKCRLLLHSYNFLPTHLHPASSFSSAFGQQIKPGFLAGGHPAPSLCFPLLLSGEELQGSYPAGEVTQRASTGIQPTLTGSPAGLYGELAEQTAGKGTRDHLSSLSACRSPPGLFTAFHIQRQDFSLVPTSHFVDMKLGNRRVKGLPKVTQLLRNRAAPGQSIGTVSMVLAAGGHEAGRWPRCIKDNIIHPPSSPLRWLLRFSF